MKLLSFFSDSLRFSKLLGKDFILVDLSIELKLKSILRGLDKEITNHLGNGVSHISENNLEVSINSCSDFSNEEVAALLLALEDI
jgi:hypothetical protein